MKLFVYYERHAYHAVREVHTDGGANFKCAQGTLEKEGVGLVQ